MKPYPPEEEARITAELDGLSERVITEAAQNWPPKKRQFAEGYLERKAQQRHDRVTARDRRLQKWILAFAVGTFVATVLTWLML